MRPQFIQKRRNEVKIFVSDKLWCWYLFLRNGDATGIKGRFTQEKFGR
jgi:hypothetical protein